ncbi:MAG: N-acyl-D-amino-acid deacylase family protein [Candidatus Bathyarchaeia archaeon]
MYDLIIKNGRIIDGAGNPWYLGDIAISDGRIRGIGPSSEGAVRSIAAGGLIVSPGFIDAHSHSDYNTLVYRDMESTLHQGITTVMAGQCGSSPAPISDEIRGTVQKRVNDQLPEGVELEVNWTTFDDYLREEEKAGLGANVGHLVGHGAIRAACMGYDDRKPTDEEMECMRDLTGEAMKAGAYGISTGLIYPPGMYAETKELIEVAKVAAMYGGIYDSHIRGEGRTLMEALREALEIGETAGIPVQISHHKIASSSLWGSSRETLEKFEEARERGIDVTVDQYPYKAGSTGLMALLPPWAHDGGTERALERLEDEELRNRMRKDIAEGIPGWENFAGELGWENVYVTSVKTDENKELEGKNMEEIKELRGDPDEYTALFNLLLEEEGGAGMVIFYGDEGDVRQIMRHPLQMVGTDASSCTVTGPFSRGKPHPRHYGTYPKILGEYVREEGIMRLEEAIRKMTSFPAQRFGLLDRGLLRPGMWADITIFDPDTIRSNSTYQDPHHFPEGIHYVIVNGEVAIDEGEYTGILSGRTLRKKPKKFEG